MSRKKLLNNIITLSLSVSLLISAAYCCCLTAKVHASEGKTSCPLASQTHEATPLSNNDKDCECNKTSDFVVEKSAIDFKLVQATTPLVEEPVRGAFFISLFSIAYHESPNLVDNTIPIYLQNSTFRI